MSGFNIDDRRILSCINFGSYSISCSVAHVSQEGIEVLTNLKKESLGIRGSQVVDFKILVQDLKLLIEEIEFESNVSLNNIIVCIGNDFHSYTSSGMALVQNKEIQLETISSAIQVAKAISIPESEQILHVFPKKFSIDQKKDILNPIGMTGLRLETDILMLSVQNSFIKDILKCMQSLSISVSQVLLSPVACAEASVTDSEKHLGVAFVNIGTEKTDVLSYEKGRLQSIKRLPIGGSHFTKKIMQTLKMEFALAEKIKQQFCFASGDLVLEESLNKEESQKIKEILNFTSEELLKMIKSSLDLNRLDAGIIFAGGGAQLKGFTELAKFLIEKPVKKALIKGYKNLSDINSEFLTTLGALKYCYFHENYSFHQNWKDKIYNFKTWLKDLF